MPFRLFAILLGLFVALAAAPVRAPSAAETTEGPAAARSAIIGVATAISDIRDRGAGGPERHAKRCDGAKGTGAGGPGCAAGALPPGEPFVAAGPAAAAFDPDRHALPIGRQPEPPRHPPRSIPA